jgi:hypothetical protein
MSGVFGQSWDADLHPKIGRTSCQDSRANLNLLKFMKNMVNQMLQQIWISAGDNAVDAAFRMALSGFA